MQARASKLLSRRVLGSAFPRSFHNGAGAGASLAPLAQVPALAQPSSPSLLSLIFGRKSAPGPSLLEPLPGMPVVPPLVESSVPAETKVTVLANGLTIASQDSPGPKASVGVFVNSGSVWETPYESGLSHVLERAAFKSTSNRSHFRFVREVEAIGANLLASASREQMAYTADVVKLYVPEAIELLADTVRNSIYNDWEVKEAAQKLAADVNALHQNPESVLVEALHSAGFAGALGNPLVANAAVLGRINGQQLFEFASHNYTAPRIVVAGAGVDHEEFTQLAELLFVDLPAAQVPLAPQSKYIGGDVRLAADSPLTHLGFAFEAPGGWRNEKDSITSIVFQALMGGGLSFSAGGPGKGMYSRLYQRVLNRYPEAQVCSFFASLYNDTGLIGIHAASSPSFIPNLVDVVVNELQAVAKPGGVTEQELERAKNATVAGVLMNLETTQVTAEDIGRQILTYGHRKPPQAFVDQVKGVTPADITAFAQKILKTPLTFAAYGDVVHVPRFDQISSRFT